MQNKIDIPLSPAALYVLKVLEDAGFTAWAVGGCVRDALLGRPMHDVDICSSATWQQAARVFVAAGIAVHETGTAHGTITAVVKGEAFEVTTFRTEGTYSDVRHPDSVKFVSTVEEDLGRRDFTVNAMAYHPQRGLCDPYGGQADLAAGVLRAVGNPQARFSEDALRILRAVRFASQLGFVIEPTTAAGMRACAAGLCHIAAERIAHELEGMLCGDHVADALLAYADVVCAPLPELAPMVGFEQQSKYHIYDVWEHTAWVVARTQPTPRLRWAALLHDSGKPSVFFVGPDGYGHFYGHAKVSVDIARQVLARLKFSPKFIQDVCLLVRYHDAEVAPRRAAIKRLIRRMDENPALVRELCNLKRADSLAHAPQYQTGVEMSARLGALLEEVLAAGEPFAIHDLAISGHDIIDAGIAKQGPVVGELLRAALDEVVEERLPNAHDALMAYVAQYMKEW